MDSNIKKLFDFSNNPIWLMRQAGRYMKEYNIIKGKFESFFKCAETIPAVTEITMLPVENLILMQV